MKQESEVTVLRDQIVLDILRVTSNLDPLLRPIPVRLDELKEKVGLSNMSNVEFGRHLSAISGRLQERRIFQKKRDHVGAYYLVGKRVNPDTQGKIL